MSENNKYSITWEEIFERVDKLPEGKYFGVPRGGTIVAGLTRKAVFNFNDADYIIDDLIDFRTHYALFGTRP